MIRDHRPHYIKRAHTRFQRFYTRRFIRPQFASLGRHPVFIKPWYIEIFGPFIEVGDHAHIIAAPDMRTRFAVWSSFESQGRITVGDYCLICPGVRIGAALEVRIGNSCMIASNAYITDSDWHGVYDRNSPGRAQPVHIRDNVWIGDRALVCKGVNIGRNSIIGAGSVVTKDVPPDAIAAGNPAAVVKRLQPDTRMVAREHWFEDPDRLRKELALMDRAMLKGNTVFHWLRHLFFPRKGD